MDRAGGADTGADDVLAHVRELCMALPEVTERPSGSVVRATSPLVPCSITERAPVGSITADNFPAAVCS